VKGFRAFDAFWRVLSGFRLHVARSHDGTDRAGLRDAGCGLGKYINAQSGEKENPFARRCNQAINRSELIRMAVEQYLELLQREKLEQALVEGYTANAEQARRTCQELASLEAEIS
jgi:hypothetical protein